MRVAFILNSSGLYGANRSLLGLLQYLKENAVECYAVLPREGDVEQELIRLNIEYVIATYRACVWYPGYIGMPFLVNLFNIPKIAGIIKGWNVDIIHTNNSNIDIGIIIAKLLKKKHVWHVREMMELFYNTRYIFPRLYKRMRKASDVVICVSEYVFNYHMRHFPNSDMKMIYNPYDVKYYNITRENFAPKEKIVILMAGAFAEKKRQIDSVKAVKCLVDRGVHSITLILIGDGEKDKIDEVKNYVEENQLHKYVCIKSFVSDLRKIREKADIALCCSVDEALPRVVVEGMLGELLAIGANSGGVAELIENGVTGLLYEVGNSEQLADKIAYAISHKEECRQMIIRAKQYAIENFELSKSGKKMLKVYEDLMDVSI